MLQWGHHDQPIKVAGLECLFWFHVFFSKAWLVLGCSFFASMMFWIMLQRKLIRCLCSVVVITWVSHTQGPWFKSRQRQFLKCSYIFLDWIAHTPTWWESIQLNLLDSPPWNGILIIWGTHMCVYLPLFFWRLSIWRAHMMGNTCSLLVEKIVPLICGMWILS